MISIDRVLLVGLCSENELHVRASKHTVRNTEGLGNVSKGMKLYHGIGITKSTKAWKPEWYRNIQIQTKQIRTFKMFADLWVS